MVHIPSPLSRYEQSKRAAAREVAAIRHGWVKTRTTMDTEAVGQLHAPGRAKQLSDHLSHYIENDVDRLLREAAVGIAPTSFPVQVRGSEWLGAGGIVITCPCCLGEG